MFKKHNFDLNQVQEPMINASKMMLDGVLAGLPTVNNGLVMYYNKDLFDRFAVAYPRAGWTWEDVHDASRRLTRMDGDIQYYGLRGFHDLLVTYNQLSLPLADPVSQKALFNSPEWAPGWAQWFRALLPSFQIPEMIADGKSLRAGGNVRDFFAEGYTAMGIWQANLTPQKVNWDIAPFPSFSHLPGVGPQANPQYVFVGSASQKRDEAFLAIAVLMEEETQLDKAKNLALGGSLRNPAILEAVGQNVAEFAGKNAQYLYSRIEAAPTTLTENTNFARGQIGSAFNAVAAGLKDLESEKFSSKNRHIEK